MKYLLMIHMNPAVFETLSEAERTAVVDAHDEFQKRTRESGELVGFAALADPSNTTTVRVRGDVPAVTDGPYLEVKEHLAGFYVVDCETVERVNELAAMVPDARFAAVEVRPVMEDAGLEM
ncbi:MAG TPA: YciI family protein [Acidimicrobiales bacterium]|nr:YciI family protein [Acidimicrobiales bacterium]